MLHIYRKITGKYIINMERGQRCFRNPAMEIGTTTMKTSYSNHTTSKL